MAPSCLVIEVSSGCLRKVHDGGLLYSDAGFFKCVSKRLKQFGAMEKMSLTLLNGNTMWLDKVHTMMTKAEGLTCYSITSLCHSMVPAVRKCSSVT